MGIKEEFQTIRRLTRTGCFARLSTAALAKPATANSGLNLQSAAMCCPDSTVLCYAEVHINFIALIFDRNETNRDGFISQLERISWEIDDIAGKMMPAIPVNSSDALQEEMR